MSFSRRDSIWANSALVVTVAPDDPILDPYKKEFGVLVGVAFQRDMEGRAAIMGGGNLPVPVQRVADFIAGTTSETVPSSSYRLGIKSSPCHEIYPPSLTNAIRDALGNYFDKQMPGFVSDEGLLHAVETRTSSPVQISEMAPLWKQTVYKAPSPGFAGGIVSAAVDGLNVAKAIIEQLMGSRSSSSTESSSQHQDSKRSKRAVKNAGDLY
jgi:uncharacterized FAD-dependent dehydrogenase